MDWLYAYYERNPLARLGTSSALRAGLPWLDVTMPHLTPEQEKDLAENVPLWAMNLYWNTLHG